MILIFALPWCLSSGFHGLKTEKIWLHASRGLFSTLGALSIFYAIKHIGLGDVTAITKLEQIALLIIGILYFKEQITKTKIGVIIVSLLGAVMIIRPDFFPYGPDNTAESVGFNSYYVFVFLTIVFWGINSTVIKVLGKTEKTKVQLFYVMLFSCMIAFPVSFMEWHTYTKIWVVEIKYPTHFVDVTALGLEWGHLKYIALLALCYFGHVVGYFKAFKHAELSVVVPLEYTRLVFAGILGYIFFAETPLAVSLGGYVLIIFGGLFLFKAEHRKAKKQRLKELEAEVDNS
jgi:S-adenosylmethionine uptake transporter